MTIRTTDGAVKGILQKDYDSRRTPSLSGYIESASSLIDEVVACALRKGVAVASAKAELLERWVSAHCYVLMDQTYAEKKTGDARAVYHGRTGMNLESSRYGQFALTLDTTGCLRALSAGRKARVTWVGKTPSEQTDYEDRD